MFLQTQIHTISPGLYQAGCFLFWQSRLALCVDTESACKVYQFVCVCGGGYHYWTKGLKYRPKHTRFCVSISVNVTFVVASENQSHNFQDFLHKILCFGSFSNTQATVQSCCQFFLPCFRCKKVSLKATAMELNGSLVQLCACWGSCFCLQTLKLD